MGLELLIIVIPDTTLDANLGWFVNDIIQVYFKITRLNLTQHLSQEREPYIRSGYLYHYIRETAATLPERHMYIMTMMISLYNQRYS